MMDNIEEAIKLALTPSPDWLEELHISTCRGLAQVDLARAEFFYDPFFRPHVYDHPMAQLQRKFPGLTDYEGYAITRGLTGYTREQIKQLLEIREGAYFDSSVYKLKMDQTPLFSFFNPFNDAPWSDQASRKFDRLINELTKMCQHWRIGSANIWVIEPDRPGYPHRVAPLIPPNGRIVAFNLDRSDEFYFIDHGRKKRFKEIVTLLEPTTRPVYVGHDTSFSTQFMVLAEITELS